MSIGLKRGTVRLEPHDTEWERSAQTIIGRLEEMLQDLIDEILMQAREWRLKHVSHD